MASCRNVAVPQMPLIPYQAVSTLGTGRAVGCSCVQTGATPTTPRLIVEFKPVYLNHTATV